MNSTQLKTLAQTVSNTQDFNVFKLRTRRFVTSDAETALLWYIYMLGKNTTYFDDDVREHLYENRTYEELSEKYDITIPSLRNKAYRQVKQLDDIVPFDLLNLKKDTQPSEVIETLLAEIKDIYDSTEKLVKTLNDYFVLDVLSERNVTQDFTDIDEDDFEMARDVYVRLSLPNIDFLMENTPAKLKDYIAYLLTTPTKHLLEKDRLRKENIHKFLRIPYLD